MASWNQLPTAIRRVLLSLLVVLILVIGLSVIKYVGCWQLPCASLGDAFKTHAWEPFVSNQKSYAEENRAGFVGTLWGVLGGLFLISLAFTYLSQSPRIASMRLALVAGLCGAAIGWMLGIVLSPSSGAEEEKVSGLKGILTGAVGTYLVTKFGDIYSELKADKRLLTNRSLTYTFYFVASLALATLSSYQVREYGQVRISPPESGDLKASAGTPVTFRAEAPIAKDSSVHWSLDPDTGAGSIDPKSGVYCFDGSTKDESVIVVATANADPTKSARRKVTLSSTTKVKQCPKQSGSPATATSRKSPGS
jgi:sulfite exporter TauE/SafE